MAQKPVLSIGIIFKNEIRCLERCLKSLQPLRDAAPCELVMADTGSDDGSREIAEKYADILFDFPWIDDFSAARNAVMDRCSGEWYFSIDCDEWLDQDVSVLLRFLGDEAKRKKFAMGAVMVRNYVSEDLETQYSDLLGVRMLRMDTGRRYSGAIHEHWDPAGAIYGMDKMILHHDGYVGLGEERGRPKRERNMKLLRQELEKNPESLMCLLQCIESSGGGSPESVEYLERAVRGVDEKWTGWEIIGPSIYRHVVRDAKLRGLPDLDEKAARARELFPDSPFITIDATYIQFSDHIDKKEYETAIPYGEAYLAALEKYRQGGDAVAVTLYSTLSMVSPMQESMTRILMADAYFKVGAYEKSRDMLETLKGEELNEFCVKNCMGIMANLQAQSGLELSGLMARFWKQIVEPVPDEARAAERQRGVASLAVQLFSKPYRLELEKQNFRQAYTLFTGLAGVCGWGDAAAILEETDSEKLTELLRSVQKWKECPIESLSHALRHGASFPPLDKPLRLEEIDGLAARMARDCGELCEVLKTVSENDFAGSWQTLAWTRALALAAVQAFDWKEAGAEGLGLARIFARVERAFLVGCYAPEVLREGNLFVLPPMHRFGWHCAQAFEALEAGDAVGCARSLRAGLESSPDMKDMVEYLTDNTPELQAPPPSAELLALAEKVRAMLAAYPADDPAVAALKASPAYQKVAYLIEGDSE